MVHKSFPELAQQPNQVRADAFAVASRLAGECANGQPARADKRPVAVAGFRLSEKGNEVL